MRDLLLAALQRNRETAKKAGQFARVERIDARLARLTGSDRSAEVETEEPEVVEEVEEGPAAPDVEDFAQGGGWYLIHGEKIQGRAAALAALNADED